MVIPTADRKSSKLPCFDEGLHNFASLLPYTLVLFTAFSMPEGNVTLSKSHPKHNFPTAQGYPPLTAFPFATPSTHTQILLRFQS